MSWLDATICAALGCWFAASCIAQFPLPGVQGIRLSLAAPLIPNWRLFAPNPITVDYVVLYRLAADGDSAPWCEYHIGDIHQWSHAIVYPKSSRQQTMLSLVMLGLSNPHHERNPVALKLLKACILQCTGTGHSVQVAIVRVDKRDGPRLVYFSSMGNRV